MEHGNRAPDTPLHTLIPLTDFKAILGIDDREDCLDFASVRNQGYEFLPRKNSAHLFQPPSLAAFCLIMATYTIEQYCRRSLFVRRHFERFEYARDLLRGPDTFHNHYDFSGPHAVLLYSQNRLTGSLALVGVLREYPVREVLAVYAYCSAAGPELIEPEFYSLCPEVEEQLDMPHTLRLSPSLERLPGLTAFKAVYRAGYRPGKTPADLASAGLELAAWNMVRYRGPPLRSRFLIGMTGNVRGNGKDGEHLEAAMPEQVRHLLEPYQRRII
jgi:hypothetical protein